MNIMSEIHAWLDDFFHVSEFHFDFVGDFIRFCLLRFELFRDHFSLFLILVLAASFFYSARLRKMVSRPFGGGYGGRYLGLCFMLGTSILAGADFAKSVLRAFAPADGVILEQFSEEAIDYTKKTYFECLASGKTSCEAERTRRERMVENFLEIAAVGDFGYLILEPKKELMRDLASASLTEASL